MGFFSWTCKNCNIVILSMYADNVTVIGSDELKKAVFVMPNNRVFKGIYDGYGNCGGYSHEAYLVGIRRKLGLSLKEFIDLEIEYDEPDVYHIACYNNESYNGGSKRDSEQGFFYNNNMIRDEMLKNIKFIQNLVDKQIITHRDIVARIGR